MAKRSDRDLALELLHADSEDRVIEILKAAGYWDLHSAWRYYGDRKNNFRDIHNQQSRPDAALVEKVVNSLDARLMAECMKRGMRPDSPEAPRSIRQAVARFFEAREVEGEVGGKIRDWAQARRTEVSRDTTLAATGDRRTPSYTIADLGEGQTPDRFPETLVSLDRENKLKIHFVQGKFNMGGTGVLRFCGKRHIQLILSKRHPEVIKGMRETDPSQDLWGFTIVRRESPSEGERDPIFAYLAPLGAEMNPRRGGVMRFRADELPLMPQGNEPYKRSMRSGTVIKLYDYESPGFSSHILRKDGLLYRLEVLLPELALPVRLYECRDYRGHEGSFETPLSGIVVRLEDGKGENLEAGFPVTSRMNLSGEDLVAKIYAFKPGKAETYRKNEGIIVTINGQTHGSLPPAFFGRNNVGMGRLADSLLVTVDASSLSMDSRADLFMNSRDRLSNGELRQRLEAEMEEILCNHPGLRELRERRRREELESRIADDKPLESVLETILRSSPSLSSLFVKGSRLSVPLKDREVVTEQFKGRKHPTYFKFYKKDYGASLTRTCPQNRRPRMLFDTDAVNDYFERVDPTIIMAGASVLEEGDLKIDRHGVVVRRAGKSSAIWKSPADKTRKLIEIKPESVRAVEIELAHGEELKRATSSAALVTRCGSIAALTDRCRYTVHYGSWRWFSMGTNGVWSPRQAINVFRLPQP